jgi:phosphoglycerate kinase
MKSIKEVSINGLRVLIRVDFNVPMDENRNITDDTRIRSTLETLQYALDNNAKIIIASHMGRPKGSFDPNFSLSPVAEYLSKLINKEVKMAPDCVGEDVKELVSKMEKGDILLLENLRFHSEEKKNDDTFAKELASLCDVYVNNAFGVSHRAHASVAAITKYATVSVAGLLLQKEIDYFDKAINTPQRPIVAVIGGAKVSSKLSALENMLQHVDKLIIGGAMANTFLKSIDINVGKSLVENDLINKAKTIIEKAKESNTLLYLPVDVVISKEIDQNSETKNVPVDEIPEDWMALDIGPATSLLYSEVLNNAKTIIWNGPMGVFEIEAFSSGTMTMVSSVANSSALTIVGGGDTDVAIHRSNESDKITYISTGGGAFLYLMEGKILPSVIALNEAEKKS